MDPREVSDVNLTEYVDLPPYQEQADPIEQPVGHLSNGIQVAPPSYEQSEGVVNRQPSRRVLTSELANDIYRSVTARENALKEHLNNIFRVGNAGVCLISGGATTGIIGVVSGACFASSSASATSGLIQLGITASASVMTVLPGIALSSYAYHLAQKQVIPPVIPPTRINQQNVA